MLNDPKSNLVRGVAKLAKKESRTESGLFLLEGPQGLKEVAARSHLIAELYATAECLERYSELFATLAARGRAAVEVSERVLEVMSDTKTPQGVVAVCQQIDVTLDQIIDSKPKLVAVLAEIRDPGNAGTVLRAADAAGADAVIFTTGSVDIYNPKVVRSTTGSLFHLPIAQGIEAAEAIGALKQAGLQVFAADANGEELTQLPAAESAAPTAWLFGNEAWGFEPETLALADKVVSVPIYGKAESLNLATAASVCLYATAMAQRG